MVPTFKQFLNELTGWRSWDWAAGAHIPVLNLAGVTTDTSGTNFIRGAYGNYDQPLNPSKAGLANYRDEVKKGVIKGIKQMGLPSVEKQSKIKFIQYKQNPILIYLTDGTRLFLSLDDYRNIGSPEKGKTLKVSFQRRTEDRSSNPSQITNIEVI